MLYALQGAILDIPWNELPNMKEELRLQAGEVGAKSEVSPKPGFLISK
jgi:hypothetical protein